MESNNDAATHPTAARTSARRAFRPRLALARILLAGLLATGVIGAANAHPEGAPPETTYQQMDLAHLHGLFAHLVATADPDRKAAFQALGASAHEELQGLNERALAAHRHKVELLLQDRVDVVALDRARAEEIDAANRLAERIDAALVDLAGLMTPAQRAQMRNHVSGHAD